MNPTQNSKALTSKSTLKYFLDISENRVKLIKNGRKLTSTIDFQKKVHNSRSLSFSPNAKVVPLDYPLPLGIDFSTLEHYSKQSPTVYLRSHEIFAQDVENLSTAAMQEYLSTKNFSDVLEHKKLGNIQSFFAVRLSQEKFRVISRKMESVKPLKISTKYTLKALTESPIGVEGKKRFTRGAKQMLALDNMIIDEIKKEEDQVQEDLRSQKTDEYNSKRSKKLQEPIINRFSVLNQRAGQFLRGFPDGISNLGISAVEDFYGHQRVEKKLPLELPTVKKSLFFDPKPLKVKEIRLFDNIL